MSLDTPIALFLFNRPEQTRRVFAQIASAKPCRLLLIADGPRDPDEQAIVEQARAVTANIDWPCEVSRDFSAVHLGCKRRMSSGIDWVFSQCEQAILLEDDCLPDPTFFPYCQELLDRYESDERVMTIAGANFQFGARPTPHSYYFSAIHHIWGWATWRRAWKHYDVQMQQWPAVAQTDFPVGLLPTYAAAHHRRMMAQTFSGKLDTWDVQWTLSCWLRGGLCVLPSVNLISNIGYGATATHTRKTDLCAALPTEPMEFPLRHPPYVDRCTSADDAFLRRTLKAA
jgi:hypothetical protein